ncbi:MAG: hypothetical protein N2327_07060 [Caldimicrobium sp.]|nr:hypothetical protein [Caldimicrobium sp.]MCX7874172.1 hypothetical protein [Caldimicrobium sp.]MDW8094315.1 hypothetical protein [Caldimicrobium sp.]
MSHYKKILVLVLLTFKLLGCGIPEGVKEYPPYLAERIKTIVVLPFDHYCPTESPLPFYCPVTGVIPGEIEPHAREFMNELLRKELEALTKRYTLLILSQNDYETLLESALEVAKTSEQLINYFAKETGAQALLYGKIFRFKQRKGSSWAVESPASIAFTLILYDGQTGRILWQRTFDETQKPLSEDILKLPLYGKIKWLTVEELAERGLKNLLKTFPYR